MSERRPSPFKTLLDTDVCTLIQAAEDVYQIRFKNRAANAYLVRGSSREVVEGKVRARTVVLEFPSYVAALACYRSSDYQAAAALRKGKAMANIVADASEDRGRGRGRRRGGRIGVRALRHRRHQDRRLRLALDDTRDPGADAEHRQA